MPNGSISSTLDRLKAAAQAAQKGFPTTEWKTDSGEKVQLDGGGVFAPLNIVAGRDYILESTLTVPASVRGISLVGEPLQATLFCLYPARINFNGTEIFADDSPPVASGPALFQIVPKLKAGRNGKIRLSLRIPKNQTSNWCRLHLTTPALRQRHEALDLAWAQLALADAVAATPRERQLVERAARTVPDPILPASAPGLALERILSPLSAKIQALRVHVISHSHIDINWLWTWPDTVEVIRRDFKSVLAMMDDYPELTFSHSQAAVYDVVRREEPADFARVLAHIKSGRWEALTMNWVEGDSNMAAGESLARQFSEAVDYTEKTLGIQPVGMHAPDSFGHAGNLPQLAKSAGAEFYYHARCNPGGADPWPVYWWEGQGGSRLLTLWSPVYNGDLFPSDIAKAVIRAHRNGQRVAVHFHGVGDHGGGPARQSLDMLRRNQKNPLLPSAFCSTLRSFAREAQQGKARLPVHRGELNSIFEGCYTTHADAKRGNRRSENLLITAESLSTLAGQNHSSELRSAWRKVLLHQFHDILPGSAIHESYVQTEREHRQVAAVATRVIKQALGPLQSHVPAGTIAVTNPLGFARTDWVTIPELRGQGAVTLQGGNGERVIGQYGREGLGFLATAPAFGTAGYRIVGRPASGALSMVPKPSFAPNHVREAGMLTNNVTVPLYLKIETDHFRVFVRRDSGIITEFFDKRAHRELIGFGMRRSSDYLDLARVDLAFNVFQLLEEPPHRMSAWQILEVQREQSLLNGATTRVVETGPARCTLEVTHTLRQSKIRQFITFYRELPRVDFRTTVDWHERGGKEVGIPNLKVSFTGRVPVCEAWFETPFAAVQRPADGQEVPALRWADVGGPDYGFAILNDSKHGYDALGCRLRLTLLRSSYEPDSIPDLGRHEIRFALYPHQGDWRRANVVEAGASFNQPLLATVKRPRRSAAVRGFTPTLDRQSIQLSCLKAAQEGTGTILRLYESTGRGARVKLSGIPQNATVIETTLDEKPVRRVTVKRGTCALGFRPWQVTTLLVQPRGSVRAD